MFRRKSACRGSPVAAGARDGGWHFERNGSAVCQAVFGGGAPSIAPERLFRALLLQIFYSGRSERMLIETALQPAVPVVRGDGDGRSGAGPCGVQQESGALAEPRGRRSFFGRVLKLATPYLSD